MEMSVPSPLLRYRQPSPTLICDLIRGFLIVSSASFCPGRFNFWSGSSVWDDVILDIFCLDDSSSVTGLSFSWGRRFCCSNGDDGAALGCGADTAAFSLSRSLLLSGEFSVLEYLCDAAYNSIMACCSVNDLAFLTRFLSVFLRTLPSRLF